MAVANSVAASPGVGDDWFRANAPPGATTGQGINERGPFPGGSQVPIDPRAGGDVMHGPNGQPLEGWQGRTLPYDQWLAEGMPQDSRVDQNTIPAFEFQPGGRWYNSGTTGGRMQPGPVTKTGGSPAPTTPGAPAPTTGGPPPTVNRHDPASVAAYVAYYAQQPGANPSLARDPNYWIQKITSGELGDDPGYYVSKFMTPEGAPAGQGGGMAGNFSFQYDPNSPDAKFIRDEALRAVSSNAAAHGTSNTGGTWRALQDRAAGLASTDLQNQFNRQYATNNLNFNQGFSLADLGFRAAGASSGAAPPTATTSSYRPLQPVTTPGSLTGNITNLTSYAMDAANKRRAELGLPTR